MPVCVQAQRSRVVPAPPQDELRGQHSGIGGQCSLGPGLVLGAGGGPPQSAPRSWAEPHGTDGKVGPQGDRGKVPAGPAHPPASSSGTPELGGQGSPKSLLGVRLVGTAGGSPGRWRLHPSSQRTEHGNCRHCFTLRAALSGHEGSSDVSKYPCMLKAVYIPAFED